MLLRCLVILFLILIILFMVGCGLYLPGKVETVKELKSLRLSTNDPYNPLIDAIKQQLRLNNINLINENIQNVPILKIVSSSENSKTISIYQDGRNAEKQLKLLVSAQFILSNRTIYPVTSSVECSFFDNPLKTLAKDTERELLKQEMYEQVACQLIHKLLIIHSIISNDARELISAKKILLENSK